MRDCERVGPKLGIAQIALGGHRRAVDAWFAGIPRLSPRVGLHRAQKLQRLRSGLFGHRSRFDIDPRRQLRIGGGVNFLPFAQLCVPEISHEHMVEPDGNPRRRRSRDVRKKPRVREIRSLAGFDVCEPDARRFDFGPVDGSLVMRYVDAGDHGFLSSALFAGIETACDSSAFALCENSKVSSRNFSAEPIRQAEHFCPSFTRT